MSTVPATVDLSPPGGKPELIESLSRPLDIPRKNRVYVNRNLRLDKIEMVGFDMDYTLAIYDQARIEELSMRATLDKLCVNKGYPEDIRHLVYDPTLAIRGLVVDRTNGNIFKPDRYGFPGRARHGLRAIDRDRIAELYQRERMRLSTRRYAWIDSLFALPEAVLYGCLVDYFDRTPGRVKPDYASLWDHIRECIDLAHRDGSIKEIVRARMPDFIESDPHLAETLHKLRSSGKRLFLLTNSAWDYTSTVMSYLLDGVRGGYPSWRNYFDVIVVSAAKPEFFTDEHPFLELDANGAPLAKSSDGPFQRGRVYAGIRSVLVTNTHLSRDDCPLVVELAALRAHDGLDVLRPPPARIPVASEDGMAADIHDRYFSLVGQWSALVGGALMLDLESGHRLPPRSLGQKDPLSSYQQVQDGSPSPLMPSLQYPPRAGADGEGGLGPGLPPACVLRCCVEE
jgi:HAD superfamily 5'-nucleotidase-like hydrolase